MLSRVFGGKWYFSPEKDKKVANVRYLYKLLYRCVETVHKTLLNLTVGKMGSAEGQGLPPCHFPGSSLFIFLPHCLENDVAELQ